MRKSSRLTVPAKLLSTPNNRQQLGKKLPTTTNSPLRMKRSGPLDFVTFAPFINLYHFNYSNRTVQSAISFTKIIIVCFKNIQKNYQYFLNICCRQTYLSLSYFRKQASCELFQIIVNSKCQTILFLQLEKLWLNSYRGIKSIPPYQNMMLQIKIFQVC